MSISLKVSVKIDRKAALLAGKICGERETIEVTQDAMGEHWKTLVEGLSMDSNPPVVRVSRNWGMESVEIPYPSESELVQYFGRLAAEDERTKAESLARDEKYHAQVRASLHLVNRPIRAVSETEWRTGSGQDYETLAGWVCNIADAPDWIRAEFQTQIDECLADADARNKGLLTQNWPRIKAERERLAAEKAEADAKAAAEAETARLARFATRLATGYWEMETGDYNERRYSAPWCAKVTFPNGAKPVYEFGESTGKWGHSGLLRIACKPGEIIAWGQKDLRRPDRSDHNMLIMRPDGGMDDTDRTEAFHHWQAQQKTA